MTRLDRVRERLAPLRTALLEHPLYHDVGSLDALRLFMQHHAFAVWDFMSLLKALQRRLTCVEVPWVPAGGDPLVTRFVNEIVLAEESDADGEGGYASHFGLYLRSMARCGADTAPVERFLAGLRGGAGVPDALERAGAPGCVRRFVARTFEVIDGGGLPAVASAFTFGREDLLPELFQRIVDRLNAESGGGLDGFVYYLRRHIGLDGDEHGPMAGRLVASVCGADDRHWDAAGRAAAAALEARLELWDGIHAAVRSVGVRG